MSEGCASLLGVAKIAGAVGRVEFTVPLSWMTLLGSTAVIESAMNKYTRAYVGDIYLKRRYRRFDGEVYCLYILFVPKDRIGPGFLTRSIQLIYESGELRLDADVDDWLRPYSIMECLITMNYKGIYRLLKSKIVNIQSRK